MDVGLRLGAIEAKLDQVLAMQATQTERMTSLESRLQVTASVVETVAQVVEETTPAASEANAQPVTVETPVQAPDPAPLRPASKLRRFVLGG